MHIGFNIINMERDDRIALTKALKRHCYILEEIETI
jgi:hypothetical protein